MAFDTTPPQPYGYQLAASMLPANQPANSWAQGGSNMLNDYMKLVLQQKMNPNSGLNVPNPLGGVKDWAKGLFTAPPTSSSTAIY